MQCGKCLIWQNRRQDLLYINTKYWDDCARYDKKDLLKELILVIPHFRQLQRENELLAKNRCPKGRCILLGMWDRR